MVTAGYIRLIGPIGHIGPILPDTAIKLLSVGKIYRDYSMLSIQQAEELVHSGAWYQSFRLSERGKWVRLRSETCGSQSEPGVHPGQFAHLMNVIEHEINLFVHCQLTFTAAGGLWCYGTANAKGNAMKHFRERGIYLAPSGEKFVASRERKTTSDGRRILSQFGRQLSCFLFGRYEWAFHGNPDYEVATTGNLRALKQPSDFSPDQLIDTGATAGAH